MTRKCLSARPPLLSGDFPDTSLCPPPFSLTFAGEPASGEGQSLLVPLFVPHAHAGVMEIGLSSSQRCLEGFKGLKTDEDSAWHIGSTQ